MYYNCRRHYISNIFCRNRSRISMTPFISPLSLAMSYPCIWEGLYAFTDIFVRQSIGAQAIANACWFLLDCVIV